jgi:hypothetical protein
MLTTLPNNLRLSQTKTEVCFHNNNNNKVAFVVSFLCIHTTQSMFADIELSPVVCTESVPPLLEPMNSLSKKPRLDLDENESSG